MSAKTPDPSQGATVTSEHADRACADVLAKATEIAKAHGAERADAFVTAASYALLGAAYAEIERLERAAPEPLVASMNLTAEDLVLRAVSSAGHGETTELPRWSWVGRIFSVGSTSATHLCRRFGFDPDEPRGRDDTEGDS